MTPQERTELQRLAEALELAREIDAGLLVGTTVVQQLASALLSLAAESEELRAEVENAKQHIKFLRVNAERADKHITEAIRMVNDLNVKDHLERAYVAVFEIHTGTGNA